jgi:hypothetical protein
VQLDEVLSLAALAVDGLVEMPGAALERGDDVAEIEAELRRLEAREDAALPVPTLGAVALLRPDPPRRSRWDSWLRCPADARNTSVPMLFVESRRCRGRDAKDPLVLLDTP